MFRIVRVLAVCLVGCLLVAYGWRAKTQREVKAKLETLATPLRELTGHFSRQQNHSLVVNDHRFSFRSGITKQKTEAVLAQFAHLCSVNMSSFEKNVQDFMRLAPNAVHPQSSALRFSSDSVGIAYCLSHPLQAEASISERSTSLKQSAEKSAANALRSIFAFRQGARTEYMVLWNQEPFDAKRFFSPQASLKSDPIFGLWKPFASTLLIRAQQAADGMSEFNIRSYTLKQPFDQFYIDRLTRELESLGWQRSKLEYASLSSAKHAATMVFAKGGQQLLAFAEHPTSALTQLVFVVQRKAL